MNPRALPDVLDSIPVEKIPAAIARLAARAMEEAPKPNGRAPADVVSDTWRERLWTCPAETRLGVPEVAEALGRPKSWVYRAVSGVRYAGKRFRKGKRPKGVHLDKVPRSPLPAEKVDGELVFEAGAVREWVNRACSS